MPPIEKYNSKHDHRRDARKGNVNLLLKLVCAVNGCRLIESRIDRVNRGYENYHVIAHALPCIGQDKQSPEHAV